MLGPERHESLFVLFRTNRINIAPTICNCPKQGTRQRDVAPKRPNSANSCFTDIFSIQRLSCAHSAPF